MAVAIVRTASAAGAGTGSVACTMGANPAVGNYLLCFLAWGSAVHTAGSVSDTTDANPWTKIIADDDRGGAVGTMSAWYKKVATSAACTVTGTDGTSSDTIFVYELSGVDGTTFLDATAAVAFSGSAPAHTGSSVDVGAASSLGAMGFLALAGWNNTMVETGVPPMTFRSQLGNGGLSMSCYFADGVPALTCDQNLSVSFDGANTDFNYVAVAFIVKEANGVFVGTAGGTSDDRYRYRNSQFVSHTSTLGTIRAGWPDDAMDFGLQDTGSDNVARMN